MSQARTLLGATLLLGCASLFLFWQRSAASKAAEPVSGISDAAALLRSARRTEAQLNAETAAAASTATAISLPATTSNTAPDTPASAAPVATTASARAAAGCEGDEPRPYHTVLTSSSGGYQTWQCRIMYHHWQMQKSRDPCGEMGGFTRLLTNHQGADDGKSHSDEIPTVVVKELSGMEARGYVVANRPWSMTQFIKHPAFATRIVEDYVYIAETDHILLRPMPNLATPTVPAAFNFGYMVAWGQAKIVDKFVPGLGGKTDPVGPSPVIIHKAQLLQITQLWYDFTVKICNDGEAVQALGWVREMWGWCIAAGKLGIKHRVLEAFQFEGGSIGNHERPLRWPVAATPVTPEREDMPYYLFHYTYGVEYSVEGLPMELQVGEWSIDKRHYMGGGPPTNLMPPPSCAHDRAHVLRALYNNASATLEWGAARVGYGQADQFNHLAYRTHSAELRSSSPMAAKLLGTGPWLLAGKQDGRAYRLEKMWILNNGFLLSQKGHGRWGDDAGGGHLAFSMCGLKFKLKLVVDDAGKWRLDSEQGTTVATLEATAEQAAIWSATPTTPTDDLAKRVEGSGPYRGMKAGAIYLLRGGVVQASGGAYNHYTSWHSHGDGHTVSLHITAGSTEMVVAQFTDCWTLRFPSSTRGRLLTQMLGSADSSGGGANLSAPLPPKYGKDVATDQAEWIIQPPATMCTDVCAGLTMRRLTESDRAASAAAQSAEECNGGFAWAGFGGLKFMRGGELITPWGRGTWGAPPEAQGDQPALVAEFAGFKHLLRGTIERRPDGKVRLGHTMQSRRCADNDPAQIHLASGVTRDVSPVSG